MMMTNCEIGFAGGDLFFGGVRCASHTSTQTLDGEEFTLPHQVTIALLLLTDSLSTQTTI
jgi:hypothetical protein